MPHDTSTNYGVAEGGARVTLDGTKTILLVGVGGQGTILAGQLLAMVAADAGLDVKVSEIHGMSQRGGSVSTIVRVGEKVDSMICDPGCADIVVAFESIEALRAQQFVREGGALFVNDEQIVPEAIGARMIDAGGIAREVGSPRSANVVLVGALSTALPFSVEEWQDAIRRRVPPKTVEANLEAFARGREAAGA